MSASPSRPSRIADALMQIGACGLFLLQLMHT